MRPLRIAITADPNVPVPPRLYGGIERIIDMLIRGLARRGHEVTLIAHPESATDARLIPYGVPPHHGPRARLFELAQVMAALVRSRRRVDLVHSFGRLGGLLPLLPLRRLPKVQSYQRDITESWPRIRSAARLAGPSICFTGASASVFRRREEQGAHGGRWLRIFNGVDLDRYTPVAAVPPDAPLVFLGRLEQIKGVHHAIAIARRAGRRLVIAGNRVETGAEAGYFDREIAPHLDGDRVRWIGPVDDAAKNLHLGAGLAMLMPIECEEAFGIVMAESFACGTPVIGFPRGALPEVIREGMNGYLCRDVEEAAAAVARVAAIDRRAVRADCEERFADRVIVDQYEHLYRDMVAQCGS